MSLHILPDDVLHFLAAFLPLLGLILLVWSSRTLATALHDQLTHRLDNLFVVTQPEIHFGGAFYVELLAQPQPYELQALFGAASINTLGMSTYNLVETPKGYDGPRRSIKLYRRPKYYRHPRIVVAGPHYPGVWERFLSWLQRRLEQLRTAEA
jgi:hypothetical protein